MKYYKSLIPQDLTDKLKTKGMPIEKEGNDIWCPVYAEVFDWLIENGLLVDISREYDFANEQVTNKFEWSIEKVGLFSSQPNTCGWGNTWHEAANKAIEKTLELIKETEL